MKLKWKIGLGLLVLLSGLVFMSSFFMLSMNDGMMPLPSIDPDPSPPDQPNNVDNLLNEMEFATIAFNAPATINIDDSPQI